MLPPQQHCAHYPTHSDTNAGTILPVKSVNLAMRFLIELGALAAFAYWGWQTGTSVASQILLAGVTPLLAALIWGRFIAPRAPHRLEDPLRVGIEIVIFGAATAALIVAGAPTTGTIFGIVAAVSLILMFVFGQRGL